MTCLSTEELLVSWHSRSVTAGDSEVADLAGLIIARLRSELSTLREREELTRAVIAKAGLLADMIDRENSTAQDESSLDLLFELAEAVRALRAHRGSS